MPAFRRLLAQDEELLADVRLHWVFMAGPASLLALSLAITVTVAVEFPDASLAVGWLLAAMVVVPALWLTGRFLRWRGIHLYVTTRRLVYQRGVLGRRTAQLRLRRIAEVHCTQTLRQRVIGCGRLVLELVDDQATMVDNVRRPRSLQRLVTEHLGDVRTPPYGTPTYGAPPRRAATYDATTYGARTYGRGAQEVGLGR